MAFFLTMRRLYGRIRVTHKDNAAQSMPRRICGSGHLCASEMQHLLWPLKSALNDKCVASSDFFATAVASQFLPFLDHWGFVAYLYTQRWSLTATIHTSSDCREAANC